MALNCMTKVTITDVISWRDDEAQFAGDASHEGDAATHRAYADEHEAKIELHTWTSDKLPFTCSFSLPYPEDELVEQAKEKFIEVAGLEYDLIKPDEVEYEIN